MKKVVVIGGTTEGRFLCQALMERGCLAAVTVASPLGASYMKEYPVCVGPFAADDFQTVFQRLCAEAVVDASHPFASEVSKVVETVCRRLSLPYIRLERPPARLCGEICFVKDYQQVVERLLLLEGRILVTTGTRHLREYTKLPHFQKRIVVRTLDTKDAIQQCLETGFKKEQILCGNGPFSVEENREHIRKFCVKAVVAKESGAAGGTEEKAEACEAEKIPLILLERKKVEYTVCFSSCQEVLTYLEEQEL